MPELINMIPGIRFECLHLFFFYDWVLLLFSSSCNCGTWHRVLCTFHTSMDLSMYFTGMYLWQQARCPGSSRSRLALFVCLAAALSSARGQDAEDMIYTGCGVPGTLICTVPGRTIHSTRYQCRWQRGQFACPWFV